MRSERQTLALPSTLLAVAQTPNSVADDTLRRFLGRLDGSSLVSPAHREAALADYLSLPSGHERPGRYWKINLDALDLAAVEPSADADQSRPIITTPEKRGIIACDLLSAKRRHGELFERHFGSGVRARSAKFAALNKAFLTNGAFVYVPDGVDISEPIVITYQTAKASEFPYTLVVAGEGSHCTVVERLSGSAPLVCGVAEVVSAPSAQVHYASLQTLADDSHTLFTRHALPGKDSLIAWSIAELGAELSVCDVLVRIEESGVQANIAALFFPSQKQHVDLVTTVEHSVGQAQSHTLVKSAATGFGQGRYLGNIHIAPSAHGTEAALKDDALLLSKTAHIDSVPALEIAANDVKAFHGATVGAIDESALFYMMSRGIERTAAEKLITLGFFEPAIAHFPGESLREEIRSGLEPKIQA